jgi:hypothetical protein
MNELRPPQLAVWIAESVVSDSDLREATLGDLAEDFALKCGDESPGRARLWYWSQVMRSVIPLSMMSLRRTGAVGWLRLIAAVIGGYALLAVMVIMTDGWLASVAVNLWVMSIASLAFDIVEAIVAGYLAAVFGGKTPMLAALGLGILCVAISILTFGYVGPDAPLLYRVALMLIVLPSCAFGAMLRTRQLRRASINSAEKDK